MALSRSPRNNKTAARWHDSVEAYDVYDDVSAGDGRDSVELWLNGPVDALCAMLDDWKINWEWRDLPPEAWEFIKFISAPPCFVTATSASTGVSCAWSAKRSDMGNGRGQNRGHR